MITSGDPISRGPFERGSLKTQTHQQSHVEAGHRFRRKCAIHSAKAALIDDANLIAQDVAILGNASISHFHGYIDRRESFYTVSSRQGHDDRCRSEAIAHVVL